MTPSSVGTVILAGTRPGGDPFAKAMGATHKGLIDVGGKPIVQRVIDGVKASGITRIAVSTNDPQVAEIARNAGCQVVPTGAGPSASVALAFKVLGAPLLVTTSDHALLEGSWIAGFLADAKVDCDVALMLAHRDRVEAALPGTRRTWLRFRDGEWSGCNLFLLCGQGAGAAIAAWSDIEANRKQPWKIAWQLGPRVLASYLLGKLTAQEAIAAIGRKIGVRAALVPARDGLAAVDVDKLADLEEVRRIVSQRAS